VTPWRFTLLGYKAGFAQPWFLAGVGVALVLGLIAIIVSVRRGARLSKAVPQRLAQVLAPGVSVVLPSVQSSAYTMALVFFAIALAQPQCGEKAEVAKRRGIDVVVALDASKSMYARDVTPSRLERAKLELTSLLDSLKGDRVGLVVFAGDAFIQCPLTSDYAAAKLFLRAVDPESMPQGGTNIGAALLLSRHVLENADRGAKDRVVVLLSDGEDLTGDITEGIDSLKEFGARVLAIGIGSDSGEPIPLLNKSGDVVGYRKDENGVTVISHLDRAGLTHIASATSGEFFYQPRGVAMGDVVKIIDTLQKSELESRVTMKYGEAYQPFVAVGLAFLVLGLLVHLVEVDRQLDAQRDRQVGGRRGGKGAQGGQVLRSPQNREVTLGGSGARRGDGLHREHLAHLRRVTRGLGQRQGFVVAARPQGRREGDLERPLRRLEFEEPAPRIGGAHHARGLAQHPLEHLTRRGQLARRAP
jgi:Ca-activated chloride channel family protein